MTWLSDLLIELFPLYLISLLGFIAGKILKVDIKSVTTLSIYIISPIVFVLTIAQLDFTASALIAPVVTFVLSLIGALFLLRVVPFYISNPKTPYISATSFGNNNWGYFGIPVAFALFEPEIVAAYMMLGFGLQIFENTFGIYYISRGTMSPADSLKNMLKLPSFHAIFIGIFLSMINFETPEIGLRFLELFKGAYTVLGMMIIGLGLASLTRFRIDIPFVLTMFSIRFIIWPAAAIATIFLDQHLNLLGEGYYKPLLLLSIMPMAANHIALAAQFDMNPGKVSVAVLLTTLFALIYIPAAIYMLGI